MAIFSDPTFWVLVAFVILISLLAKPIGGAVSTALDKRADKIRDEIDEAEKLREEAQELLAEYERKQRDTTQAAAAILAHAREEAERLAAQGAENLTQALKRRQQQALDRIAQAEAEAVDQIRALAVDVALDTAERIMSEQLKGKKADALVDDAIKGIAGHLN